MPSSNYSFLNITLIYQLQYTTQAIHFKALIISNEMSIFWITLNLSDLQSFLVLIFAKVHYKNNDFNNSFEQFGQIIAIINQIAIARFFKAICTAFFKHLLNAGSQANGLLKLVSTYFGKIKINGQRILCLYYLVWVCRAYQASNIPEFMMSSMREIYCIGFNLELILGDL